MKQTLPLYLSKIDIIQLLNSISVWLQFFRQTFEDPALAIQRQPVSFQHSQAVDPSVSAALKCKRANQSVSFASSDRGLTTTQLCSIETHAIVLDFRHFQAGSVDFELIVVKH